VKDVCGVHGLQGAKRLVDEVLAVVVGKFLGADYAMHVSLHEFLESSLATCLLVRKQCAHLDEVHLSECLVVAGLLDIKDRDDVLVVEVSQQLHLSQCSQTEHGMIERRDLLDGDLLTGRLVQRGTVAWLITV